MTNALFGYLLFKEMHKTAHIWLLNYQSAKEWPAVSLLLPLQQIINHSFHSNPQQVEVSNPYSSSVRVCQNESALLKVAMNLVYNFLEGQQLKQWVPVAQGEGVTDSCDGRAGHMPSSDTTFQNPVSTKSHFICFYSNNDLVACDK